MKGQRLKRHIFMLTALLIAALIMAEVPSLAFAPSDGYANYDDPIMVSLGDSYSSGEGITPYYGADKDDKFEQPDWLAHRSKLSWPGKLRLTDSKGNGLLMAQNKAFYNKKTKSYASYSKNNWYFVASSGAVTDSLYNSQGKSYDHKLSNLSSPAYGYESLENQLKVFDSIEPGTTDFVTMTMGGNDAHFADIFVYAAINLSFINVNGVSDYLSRIWNEFYYGQNSIKTRLINAYTNIRNSAGSQADIIIAGYPKILPKSGFLLYSARESQAIDESITKFNNEMAAIVQSCKAEDFKIHFVNVEKAFEGHEAFTGIFTTYFNGILLSRPDDLDYSQIISSASFHPNSKGAKAYAACVQKCINEIEQQKHAEQTAGTDFTADTQPVYTEPEALPSIIYTDSGQMNVRAGDTVDIPINISGYSAINNCSLHFEFDERCLQIDSVSSEGSVSDTIGLSQNGFDVNWSAADGEITDGELFTLHFSVKDSSETALKVTEINPKDGERTAKIICDDIIINSSLQNRCTITAELDEFDELVGSRYLITENSECTLLNNADNTVTQNALNIELKAYGSLAEVCFYKPGFTRLTVHIEDVYDGAVIDITPLLREAAAKRPLLVNGDVNRDGSVTVEDLSEVLLTENYGLMANEKSICADLNSDNFVTVEDVAIILLPQNYGAVSRNIFK